MNPLYVIHPPSLSQLCLPGIGFYAYLDFLFYFFGDLLVIQKHVA